MSFHAIDPLKKPNKYQNIGNRSKNDLYPKLQKVKNKIKKTI